ncbi:MAG: adenylate kinase [Planctomycetaceae bacterium]|jgi:adenylate kinase|nr:adenylate kinase [Planctomycetaceae bacterium]
MRLIFIGPPGAGKGTQAEKIVSNYKLTHLSTGDMLRAAVSAKTEVGLLAEKYMSSGQFVPDTVIIDIMSEKLKSPDCQNGFLLDGFPRTLPQATALDEMLQKNNTPLDVVLELKVPDDELYRRLAERGRTDDAPEVIRNRLVVYAEQTTPLLQYYAKQSLLKTVDGQGSVDVIFERIKEILDKLISS